MTTDPSKRTRAHLPPWVWGGNPKRLLEESDFHVSKDRRGGYFVRTKEDYLHRSPDLVELRTIVTPDGPGPRWDILEHITERAPHPSIADIQELIQHRRHTTQDQRRPVDFFNDYMLLLHSSPVHELAEHSKSFLEDLGAQALSDDSTEHSFPHAGLHLVQSKPALLHRLKLASVLLRVEQDPRLQHEGAQSLRKLSSSEQGVFMSSAQLYDGVLTLDAYLAPLMAAGSPAIWGVHIARSFGCLVFNLGQFTPGTETEAAELLHLVSLPGTTRPPKLEALSPPAPDGAIRWWTARLNELFGVLSDLSPFVDDQEVYQPTKQLEAILTVEQIFRRTASLLVAHRDLNARRALMFTVLDSLEGLRGIDLLTMCTLRHAKKVLEQLETSIPPSAQEVLLPAARRAVSALEKMQGGFFIRSQLGAEDIILHRGDGTAESMTPEKAVAHYLKVLRDATHGHGTNKANAKARTAALLAHHTGDVPHDLGPLAYLYLLDMLADPHRLRRILHNGRK